MNLVLEPVWQPPPAGLALALAENEIHLWCERLDQPPAGFAALLTPDETARGQRFKFPAHSDRFAVSRGLLRLILARYREEKPADLDFTAGLHGKPALADGALHFNLSHSGDLMLLAVARDREVGVDLERMRPERSFDALAEYCFPPEQAQEIQRLATAGKRQAFYERWTALEAQLKASGLGLSRGMKTAPSEKWSIVQLEPAPDYAAALAYEGPEPAVRCGSSAAVD